MNKEKEKKFAFSKRNILGEIAHWAVCQSPYHRPDNLEVVLDKFNAIIAAVQKYPTMSYEEIREMLYKLKEIPEFMLWNERKNGRQGNGFSGAGHHDDGSVTFFNAKADDDFIDLDALIRNVANSIVREGYEKPIPEILMEKERCNDCTMTCCGCEKHFNAAAHQSCHLSPTNEWRERFDEKFDTKVLDEPILKIAIDGILLRVKEFISEELERKEKETTSLERKRVVEEIVGMVERMEVEDGFIGHWRNGYIQAIDALLFLLKEKYLDK